MAKGEKSKWKASNNVKNWNLRCFMFVAGRARRRQTLLPTTPELELWFPLKGLNTVEIYHFFVGRQLETF